MELHRDRYPEKILIDISLLIYSINIVIEYETLSQKCLENFKNVDSLF